MKKTLIVLLAIFMVFGFAACGSNNEENDQGAEANATFSEALPIGEGVPDLDITGKCFGTYYVADWGEAKLAEGEELVTYHSEDCDVPYIDIFAIEKNGRTFEEFAKEDAETWGDGNELIMDEEGACKGASAYYVNSYKDGEDFYYEINLLYESDEKFYEVCLFEKTEEVSLGGGYYVYIPTGYSILDLGGDRNILAGSYDESYASPKFRLSRDENSYEASAENFAYNGDSNFTKEEYEKWNEKWDESDCAEFYEAVGYKVVRNIHMNLDGTEINGSILENLRNREETYCGIAYVETDKLDYRLNLWCDEGAPAYPFLSEVMKSVHKK